MPVSDDVHVVLYEHNAYQGRAQPVLPGTFTRGALDPAAGTPLGKPSIGPLRRPTRRQAIEAQRASSEYASTDEEWEQNHALWDAYGRDQALRAQPRVGSSSISSIRVPEGWSVTLYADDACQGPDHQTYTADTSSLGLWNDRARSVRVEGRPSAVPEPTEPDLLPDDVFSRSWVDRDYRHVNLVRHAGRLLMLAQDSAGAVVYAALSADAGTDSEGWPDVPSLLPFPRELSLVGFGVADGVVLPPVRQGATAAVPGEYVAPEELDARLSTTARLTADAPLQVVSDGASLFVFRQSAGCHEVLDHTGRALPVENGTLLMDRFLLVDDELQSPLEVRYQRSRSSSRPASSTDGLGTYDLDGNPFFEPTQALRFVRGLHDNDVAVALIPTVVGGQTRWQFVRRSTDESGLELISTARTSDGLVDTRGSQPWTCPVHADTFSQSSGQCAAPAVAGARETCGRALVPASAQPDASGSALRLPPGGLVPTDGTSVSADAFTVEVWVLPGADGGDLFASPADGGDGLGVAFDRDGRVMVTVAQSAGRHTATTRRVVTPGAWQHVSVTFDGTLLRVIVDGSLRDVTSALSDVSSGPLPLIALGSAESRGLLVDDIRVWTRPRTRDEVAGDFSQRLTGLEPGLVRYWRCDESTGRALADLCGGVPSVLPGQAWEPSGARISVPPGLTRSVVRVGGLTLTSGPAATVFFEQEVTETGYTRAPRPQKTAAVLMVAVGVSAAGSQAGDVVILTFAIGPDGNLAQSPSMIELPDADPTVTGLTRPQALSRLGVVTTTRADDAATVRELEGSLAEARDDAGVLAAVLAAPSLPPKPQPPQRQWRSDVAGRGPVMSAQDRRAQEASMEQQQAQYQVAVSRWQVQVNQLDAIVPRPPTPPSPRVAALVEAYVAAGRTTAPARTAVTDRKAEIDDRIKDLVSELQEKQTAMTAADVEIEALRGRIGGRAASWLPLLAVDPRGLTVNGARCSFFPTDSRPFLVESALGRVGLYGRGPYGEVAYAQFETVTSRPSATLPAAGGGLGLVVRSPRLLARAGSFVRVEVVGTGATTCDVTVALEGAGVVLDETWTGLPRDATTIAAVLNGEDESRRHGSRLVVAAAAQGVTVVDASITLPVVPGALSVGALSEPSHVLAHWESSRPGAALDLQAGGPAQLVPRLDPSRLRRTKDLTVEAWVDPAAAMTPGAVVAQSSGGTGYSLDLVPTRCGGSGGSEVQLLGVRASTGLGAPPQAPPPTGFTIEAWVVPAAASAQMSFLRSSGTTLPVGLGWANGRPWFGRIDEPATPTDVPPTPVVEEGRPPWRHLAGVWDGGAYWLHLDGQLVAVRRSAAPTEIHAPGEWVVSTGAASTTAAVDEVRAWSTARATSEIGRHRDRRVGPNEPGLVQCLRFAFDSATDARPVLEPPTPAVPSTTGDPTQPTTAPPLTPPGRPWVSVPGALPSLGLSARVGDTRARSVSSVEAGDWHHVAATFAERSAVRLSQPSARLESAETALDLTGDLTLELDLTLDEDSPAGVLVGRGTIADAAAGVPYELSLTPAGTLLFRWVDENGRVFETSSRTLVPRGGPTRVGVSRTLQPSVTTWDLEAFKPVTTPASTVVQFLVGSSTPEALLPVDCGVGARSSGEPTRIAAGVRATVTEVRIWGAARSGSTWPTTITRNAKGLIAWWTFGEGEAGTTFDRTASLPLGLRGGATWVPSPDPSGSVLTLYVDGSRVESLSGPDAAWPDPTPWATPGFTIGARPDQATRQLRGQVEEVRIWRTLRTTEQIQDNLFRRWSGSSADLLGRWTFEPRQASPYADQGPRGNDLAATRTRTAVSTAPLVGESPLLHDAMLELGTPFSTTTTSTPSVAEYADVQRGTSGEVSGVFKRCYGFVRGSRLHLVTGFKVGDLVTEWVGQVQTDPQLKGFVEGAPPVPSENFLSGSDYTGRSTVTLTRSDDTTYTYASSEEAGSSVSVESSTKVGAAMEAEAGLFVFSRVTKFEVMAGLKTSFEEKHGWVEETATSEGSVLGSVSELTLTRRVDDDDDDSTFRAANTGLALVESETMDVFAMRLVGSGALVSYSMLPNPDIPRDRNLITFEMNPRYTKQGTLDGRVGLGTDLTFPNASSGPGSSYFKPVEAYRLRSQVLEDAKRSEARWEQRRGRFYRRSGAEVGVKDLARRNLVNTYVWTADGGMFAEEQQSMSSWSSTTGGTYSWARAEGVDFNAEMFGPTFGVRAEVTALFGGYRECRETRASATSSSFGVAAALDGERDLRSTNAASRRVGREPGKVDAYRFMTFYLDAASNHHDVFFSQVVDDTWLQGDSAAARALRGARQPGRRPACWRILHRVTYVSRHVPPADQAASPMERTMQALDLSSVHQLVQTLDPVVRHARGTSGGLEDAVDAALARYLPELVPWATDVLSLMQLFYGDVADLTTSSLSVWAGPDQTVDANSPTTLAGRVLDEFTDAPEAACTWVQVSGPDGSAPAQFEAADRLDTAVTLPTTGSYVLRLGARTTAGAVAWDDVTITVEEVHPHGTGVDDVAVAQATGG